MSPSVRSDSPSSGRYRRPATRWLVGCVSALVLLSSPGVPAWAGGEDAVAGVGVSTAAPRPEPGVSAPPSHSGGAAPIDARLGDAIAAYALQRFSEARHRFRELAEQGDAEAAWRLAQMIEKGIGGPGDREEALYWYVQAARRQHQGALARLVALGVDGRMTPPSRHGEDPLTARSSDGGAKRTPPFPDRARLERLAGEGRLWAMIELARRLAAGRDGAIDLRGALDWLERARKEAPSPHQRVWLDHGIARLRGALAHRSETASALSPSKDSGSSPID